MGGDLDELSGDNRDCKIGHTGDCPVILRQRCGRAK